MASTRQAVLDLYRSLMKEAYQFPSYNFRMYTLRKIRDEFRKNGKETDEEKIKELIIIGEQNLRMLERQVAIGKLYATDKLVIEKKHWRDPREMLFL